MKPEMIELGYEVGTGEPVLVPLAHTAVTGQTQASGKTTTLEALISRGEGLRAVAFVTKRGEGGFAGAHEVMPYFRERADWQFVASVLEATMREKLKFERAWIMRASKGAKSLKEVQHNVAVAMKDPKTRGMSADVYLTLHSYLEIVVPQIDKLEYEDQLDLGPGLNVIDLTAYTMELQALVIRSVLEKVYEDFSKTICILPEAWEFIPQNRGSPVKMAAETLIRKGAALRNFVWLDSQDIAAVHKDIIRSIGLWILGVQREANEIKRLLEHIPAGTGKPKAGEIATLELGQFYVCHGRAVTKTYVRPSWMPADTARRIAMGEQVAYTAAPARTHRAPPAPAKSSMISVSNGAMDPGSKEPEMTPTQINEIVRGAARELAVALAPLLRQPGVQSHSLTLSRVEAPASASGDADTPLPVAEVTPMAADEEQLYARFRDRLRADAPRLLRTMMDVPEIEVECERLVLTAEKSTLRGRVALLVLDGFFDNTVAGNAAYNELLRLGFNCDKRAVYRECDKLAEWGFLTVEPRQGYKKVPGMKITRKEK